KKEETKAKEKKPAKKEAKENKKEPEKPSFEKKHTAKTEKEKKEDKKDSKEKKPVEQKPKEKKKPKAVNKIQKTKEQKKLQEKIKKKHVPTIRGHFGKAWLRRASMEKWQKWRKPRGIDFLLKKENCEKPKMGYRTSKDIRNLHPSGLQEVYVRNLSELKAIKEKNVVVRVSATIGKKTKKEMLKTAKEMNLRILN
ncbi:MAG: eL32 family ribosomal protein, partial [archaeon]